MSPRRARPVSRHAGAILFDLDGTLIRGDLARWYLLDALKRHPLRLVVAAVAAPALLPLFRSSRLRRYATASFFWILTVGRHPREVLRSFREFARRFVDGGRGEKLRAPAVTRLRLHASGPTPVALVTGCASPLATAFLKALALPRVRVVGSVVEWRAGGLWVRLHCYGARKIACAEGAGVPPPWTSCYTDSAKDLPMLALARHRVLVCPSPRTRALVTSALGEQVEIETWE